MGRILYWQYLLISIFNRIIILNSYGLKIVILLQHPFQVRSLIEYLSCKLSVGYNLPVAVVLQGAGTDVEPLTYFLACEEVFTAEERPVHLGHFLNPFPDSSQGRDYCLHFARLHTQVLNRFHHRCVVCAVLSDFTQSNRSTSSRL